MLNADLAVSLYVHPLFSIIVTLYNSSTIIQNCRNLKQYCYITEVCLNKSELGQKF